MPLFDGGLGAKLASERIDRCEKAPEALIKATNKDRIKINLVISDRGRFTLLESMRDLSANNHNRIVNNHQFWKFQLRYKHKKPLRTQSFFVRQIQGHRGHGVLRRVWSGLE